MQYDLLISIAASALGCTILYFSILVYTTQVNSAFRSRRLASSEVISQVIFQAAKEKQNGLLLKKSYFYTSKVTLRFACYSAHVVYTKTIIHLSVGKLVDIFMYLHFGE